jgi:hypothetical protein
MKTFRNSKQDKIKEKQSEIEKDKINLANVKITQNLINENICSSNLWKVNPF